MVTSEYKPTGDDRHSGCRDNNNTVGVGIGIRSEWEITLKDAVTGKVKQHIPWHRNMILDSGLNFMLTWDYGFTYYWSGFPHPTYTPFRYIAVGSGNAAPATTDTALQTQVLRKALTKTDSIELNTTDPTAPYCILGTTFVESEANGDLKEVGLCSATTGGTFFNRDLFKDGNGDPVTVTKTSNDLLVVKCKITVKRVSETPSSYNVTGSDSVSYAIKGIVTNNGLKNILNAASLWSGAIMLAGTSAVDPAPADTGIKAGSSNGSVSSSYGTAHTGPSGGFYRDLPLVANPSDCNINIAEVCPNIGAFHSRFTFSPTLAKTSAKKLTLTMRVTLSRL